MDISVQAHSNDDFIEPDNLAQLADDAALLAENELSLASKFQNINNFSNDKFQIINNSKTQYLHMSKVPRTDPIVCEDGTPIQSLEDGKSTTYIGMHLKHTNSLQELINPLQSE